MSNDQVPQELYELSKIEGINLQNGLHFCGSIKDFEKFLESFYRDIDDKSKEIENAYMRGDLEFFTIKVHALKTSSMIIGAKELHDQAASMEQAGRASNLAYIDAYKSELLESFRRYKFLLRDYMNYRECKEANKKKISAQELKEAFDALREVVPNLDYEGVELILDELSHYELPPEEQAKVDEIDILLHKFDWDGIENLI